MLKFFTDVFKLAGALLCVTAVTHPGIAQTSDPQLERILLPIFTQATPGANGSEFRVEFRAANGGNGGEARLYGDLAWLDCSPYEGLPCDDLGYISLGPGQELAPAQFRFTGAPGAYVMASSEDAGRLAMHLRVYDISRNTENFGTEIPVVREDDWFIDENLLLLGLPTDPGFRNTLRIYCTDSMTFTLRLDGEHGYTESREISVSETYFWPYVMGFAQISDLPVGVGRLRVTIEPHDGLTEFWAFNSVTNNVTQHITIISPQR